MKDEGILDDRTIIQPDDLKPGAKGRTQLPYIVIVDGPRVGRRFSLRGEVVVLGRGSQADVQLDDQSVSRQHAKLMHEGENWVIEDLGSKNGTLVNGSNISNKVVLGHKDLVKVGIYLVRLVLKEISNEEEMSLPPGMELGDKTLMTEMPSASGDTPTKTESLKDEGPKIPEPVEDNISSRSFLVYGIIAVIAIVSIGGLYIGWKYFLHPSEAKAPVQEDAKAEAPIPVIKPVDQSTPPEQLQQPQQPQQPEQPPVEGAQLPQVPAVPEGIAVPQVSANARPVFLDFVSSPLSAKIVFDSKELGTTPIRVNVELEPKRSYEVVADFYMPEIDEHYQDKKTVDVQDDKQVIPILFKAPIGVLKFNDLPRDVQVYIKGTFEHQKFKEKASKFEEVVLQKPIYLPYGQYSLELKRQRRISENSPTFLEDTIFQRSFKIAEESPSFIIEVTEESLKKFPVLLRTDPAGASVFIDGKNMGQTPYAGEFPLGKHALALRKDGYFEHTETLEFVTNTPFEVDINLQTSLAGAHINNAKAAFRRGVYNTAIDEFAQALASNPTLSEGAIANLYLGKSYLQLGDYARAMGYFEPLLANSDQRHYAMLGLVACYAYLNQREKAIPLLVEVLLKAKDDELRKEANDLFQKISPLHSILYVYTEPSGAKVFVNDKDVGQVTPLILHELALGNYKLRLEKAGYEATALNLNLSVNEFNPVIVTLRQLKE